MSEGDRYRDYDPKERVLELEHEVAALRRELEEARDGRDAKPDARVAGLTKQVEELQRELASHDASQQRTPPPHAPPPLVIRLAQKRESLVLQLLGQVIAFFVSLGIALVLMIGESLWSVAGVIASFVCAALALRTRSELSDVEGELHALGRGPKSRRVRVTDEPGTPHRGRWDDTSQEEAIDEDARNEKWWRDRSDQ